MKNMLKDYLKGQKQDKKLRDDIIRRTQGQVHWIASRIQTSGIIKEEDLVQEGYLGLIEYLESPKFTEEDIEGFEDKVFQIAYSRMMSYRFKNIGDFSEEDKDDLRSFLTSEKGVWESKDLEEKIKKDQGEERQETFRTELKDDLPEEEKYPFVVGPEEYIEAFLSNFGCRARQIEIVKDIVLRDKTNKEISEELGISGSRVNVIYGKVIKKIQKALINEPELFFRFYDKYGIRL